MAAYREARERAARRVSSARWLALFAVASATLARERAPTLVLPLVALAAVVAFSVGAQVARDALRKALDDVVVAGASSLCADAPRHVDEITTARARRRSARALRRLVRRAQPPGAARREVFDVALVRRHRLTLLAIADALETQAPAAVACALVRRLVMDAWRSPLFAPDHDEDAFAETLDAILAALGMGDGAADAAPPGRRRPRIGLAA